MPELKLIALDTDDLKIISAHLQDAVARTADMAYLPKEQRFAVILNRFDWETAVGAAGQAVQRTPSLERRRTGLRFEKVLRAKVQGIDLKDKSAALALLAITFEPAAGPEAVAGDVTLTFSVAGPSASVSNALKRR